MFSIANDIISDFGDTVGTVFDNDFEQSFLNWGLVLIVADNLPDSVAFNLGVDRGCLGGHIYFKDVNELKKDLIKSGNKVH